MKTINIETKKTNNFAYVKLRVVFSAKFSSFLIIKRYLVVNQADKVLRVLNTYSIIKGQKYILNSI